MTEREQAERIQAQMQSIRSRISQDSVSLRFHSNQFQKLRERWMRRATTWAIGTVAVGLVGIVGLRWAIVRKPSFQNSVPVALESTVNQRPTSKSSLAQQPMLDSKPGSALIRWLTPKAIQSVGNWVLPIVIRHTSALLAKRENQHEHKR